MFTSLSDVCRGMQMWICTVFDKTGHYIIHISVRLKGIRFAKVESPVPHIHISGLTSYTLRLQDKNLHHNELMRSALNLNSSADSRCTSTVECRSDIHSSACFDFNIDLSLRSGNGWHSLDRNFIEPHNGP